MILEPLSEDHLAYLRKITALPSAWIVTIKEEELDHDRPAELQWDSAAKTAVILLNKHFTFTGAAAARAVTHEMLELSTIGTWEIFLRAVDYVPSPLREYATSQYRQQRDWEIDLRLQDMPWFSYYDLPTRTYVHHDRGDRGVGKEHTAKDAV